MSSIIQFTHIRWKNFLSTGNVYTELRLDSHRSTLVLGENGSGKSTMLDALCFALFGKAFRNINKPQLVNSINQKNCRVEVDFTLGGHRYRIVRGIKPALFEIWVDGQMINQDAALRDYQKYLEETILKLNYKSFTQIVILGAASFTPFMQLTAASRREIIEDILDIKIFSVMNTLLKARVGALKDLLTDLDTQLKLAKQKVMLQQKHIESLLADRTDRLNSLDEEIQLAQEEIADLEATQATLEQERTTLQAQLDGLDTLQQERRTVERNIDKLDTELKATKKTMSFYETNDSCPTCKQHIESDFKNTICAEHQKTLTKHQKAKAKAQTTQEALDAQIAELTNIKRQIDANLRQTTEVTGKISSNTRFIQSMTIEKHDLLKKVGNVEQEQDALREMAEEVLRIANERSAHTEDKHYLDVAAMLLKDSGVKTQIIKRYLDPINQMVNKYLQAMDFFVHFELDETFNEVIKSRHRDEFSYESFSEGEKQRIDLALLFTWRTIAKMRSSASTNLLILDEIFDSSLDAAGTDYVMSLLHMMGEDANVWVISHKGDQLQDKFTHTVRFAKQQNYSIIV